MSLKEQLTTLKAKSLSQIPEDIQKTMFDDLKKLGESGLIEGAPKVGDKLKDFTLSSLRSKTAMIMQDPFLFSGTILDNIIQGQKNISRQDMEFILEVSNCKKLIEKLPDGLNTVLYEGGTSLSSGERQLISMARAFARNPDLIILDEATSYVDSETEEKVRQALYSLIKNRTSVIVAHRLSTVRHADRIIVLHKGKIIETGTHDQLMNKKGFYFRLNQLQLS